MSDLPFLMSAHRAAEVVGNFSNPLEVSWTYMTDNFSQFTILTWISFALHEVQTPLNCVRQVFGIKPYTVKVW